MIKHIIYILVLLNFNFLQGQEVLRTQIIIQPKTHLLWYKGAIGDYPIKAMLKTVQGEQAEGYEQLEILYGYEKHKKLISFNMYENSGYDLIASKVEDLKTLEELQFTYSFNSTLEGDWIGEETELPVILFPMYKAPEFTFKAIIKGLDSGDAITAIAIYRQDTMLQQIEFEYDLDLAYFKFAYVDINYDGHLDLAINENFYIYNPQRNAFALGDEDDEYFPYLTELYQYNLFDKSYTRQMNRSMIEYRAKDGIITPYHSSSYYLNDKGMVILEEDYINGKWVTVKETIEKIEEEEPMDNDVDITAPENYALTCDLKVEDGSLLFTPVFHNKTGLKLAFKKKAKLYLELEDSNGKIVKQFLHDTELDGEESYMLNDNYIKYTGSVYFLSHEKGLIPFFPINVKQGKHAYRIVLEQELFGTIKTESKTLNFPLAINKYFSIEHFVGSINNRVKGSMYIYVNGERARGTFINAKTGKAITLRGEYLQGPNGLDTISLKEHELGSGELSGFFEGKIQRIGKEEKKIFEGYWMSPDKTTTRLPFDFIQQ